LVAGRALRCSGWAVGFWPTAGRPLSSAALSSPPWPPLSTAPTAAWLPDPPAIALSAPSHPEDAEDDLASGTNQGLWVSNGCPASFEKGFDVVLIEKCDDLSVSWKRATSKILRTLVFSTFVLAAVLTVTSCNSAAEKTNRASPDAAFWRAIAEDDPEGVLAALKAGANIESTDPPEELMMQLRYDFRDTPPFIATIILKKTDLALLLLANGVDHRSRTPQGSTAVQVAVAAGDEQVFSALLAKGADIKSDLSRPDDAEEIHLIDFAARGGSLEIMSAIREAGHELPADREGKVRLLQNSLMGKPEIFEYLVRETVIELSPELKQGLIQKAREYRIELFLRYFHQQGYIPDDSLGQLLTEAILEGMDGLAEDILTGHVDLWPQEMEEAIAQRVSRGADPWLMIDMFSRLGKESDLRPHLGKIFIRYGQRGDAEKIWALQEKLKTAKSQRPELLGFALVGVLKTIHHEQKWSSSSDAMTDAELQRFDRLIEKILQQPQVDINQSDEEGRTPLWFAVNIKNEELARQLLAKGAKATPDHSPGYLHSACQRGMDGLLSDLIAAGADLEARDSYDMTPLGCAVDKGNPAMVQALLKAGADPNHFIPRLLSNPKLSNPFIGAVVTGNTEMVSIFIHREADWKIDPAMLGMGLKLGISSENAEISKIILSAVKDPESPEAVSKIFAGYPPVIFALQTGQAWMIKPLLTRGARLVPDEYTEADLMCYAADQGSLEMTRTLLDAGLGTDVACPVYPLLSSAVINGGPGLVELLVDRGADINAAIGPDVFQDGEMGGWTPLMCAAAENRAETVEVLARKGAALDVLARGSTESELFTALMVAAQKGHVDVIRGLVRAGADIDQTNPKGYTALMVAVRYAQADVVEALMTLGANPFPINQHGEGVLELAAQSGDPGVQKLLLGKTGDGEKGVALVVAAALGEIKYLNDLLEGNVFSAVVLDEAMKAAIRGRTKKFVPEKKDYYEIMLAKSEGETTDPVLTMPEDEGRIRLKIMKALVKAGCDPDSDSAGRSAFGVILDTYYDAAWKTKTARALHELGADLNHSIYGDRFTPLMEAARLQDSEMAALFLQLGADPCLHREDLPPALYWAGQDQESKARQVLIEGGAERCKN